MEFEDSRNALYCDPNAYIQKFEKCKDCEPKKVVFQEPYECLPNFYLNNNFSKGDCNCVSNHHNNNSNSNNHNCNCNNHNRNSNRGNHNDNCHNNNSSNQNCFGFDLKSLMPLLGMFNKGGGADLSQLVGLLNNTNTSQNGNNSNPMGLISSILSNKDAMSGILNMFKGGGLFGKKQTTKKEIKSTDFEIKNYTRVE